MTADGLFVYGTLREGGANHAWLQRTHPEGRTCAWVAGRLFHLPAGYPALVPGAEPGGPPPGPGWVRGDFVGYEDEVLPVVLEGGHRFKAWAYVFHVERLPRLEREAVEIQDGDWAPYL